MIHFQVTSSPDENVIAQFCFHQNQIYIGRSNGDLWINDPELQNSHMMIEVIESDLLIHPQKGIDFYLLNKKRASNIRKLKINDVITIGKTTIQILGFKETAKSSKKEILNEKLNQLIEQNASRLPVIESLSRRMK